MLSLRKHCRDALFYYAGVAESTVKVVTLFSSLVK